MAQVIANRLIQAILTLLLVSMIIFFSVEVLPGDIARRILGREATLESLEALRVQLRLGEPAITRYLEWLTGIVVNFDFGHSIASKRPVLDVLAPRLMNTGILAALSFAIYIPLSIIPAVIQATVRDSRTDQVISALTIIALSMPEFLLATLLLLMFAVVVPIFPPLANVDFTTEGWGYLNAIFLPAATLAIIMATYALRMLRDNLIETLDSEFVRTAELKGLRRTRVLFRHALPNAIVPWLNITALNLAFLIAGVVIVERVFAFPGFGSILVDSLQLRDIPVVEACALIAAAVYVLGNLVADVLAMILNPKLRT